jgi:hypothetical protein
LTSIKPTVFFQTLQWAGCILSTDVIDIKDGDRVTTWNLGFAGNYRLP